MLQPDGLRAIPVVTIYFMRKKIHNFSDMFRSCKSYIFILPYDRDSFYL